MEPLTYGRLPAVSPEAILEDYRRYLGLSAEERRRQSRAVCRDAMRRWARECRERAGG